MLAIIFSIAAMVVKGHYASAVLAALAVMAVRMLITT